MKILFVMLLVLVSNLVADEPPKTIPLKENEPSGIHPKYMLDVPENYINGKPIEETLMYLREIRKFQSRHLKMVKPDSSNTFLIGDWLIENKDQISTENMELFEYLTKIEIVVIDGYIEVGDGMLDPMYQSKDGKDYYFFTPWFNILMKPVIKDNKMFLYILKGNIWELYDIHSNGDFPYVKQ